MPLATKFQEFGGVFFAVKSVVEGVALLSGAPVNGTDLRASAAMVLAALVAKGKSQVSGLEHLDRGYADLETKLGKAGATLSRLSP